MAKTQTLLDRTFDEGVALTVEARNYIAYHEWQKPTIKVRSMTSRWGVCHMAKRQITFALQLYNQPEAAQIYVVVHEYCHFLQPNHSPAFWAEVAKLLPDWKARRNLLK